MKQKATLKIWVKELRLRTLPLALSSVITGSFLAAINGNYRWTVVVLALLTTLFLQILSNLANDYGDAVKGTDNQNRTGPIRSIQSGEISKKAMKNAVIITALFSLITGVLLLYFSLGNHIITALLFFVIGIAAIMAAIKYTVGVKAYGYHRLGDIFVFVFFGLAGVVGTYYLNTFSLSYDIFLPAISIGLFSVGVLNLNNMRDMDNDVRSGKNTIASHFGWPNAKIYHFIIIILGWLSSLFYVLINYHSWVNFLFILVLPFFINDLISIFKIKNKIYLDVYLKKLAISTFLFSILFGLGFII